MLKRVTRSVFIQGQGSNYRRLTEEEKKSAKSNFLETLGEKPVLNRIRNFRSFFKELIQDSKIPISKKVHSEFSIHGEKFSDNYSWMSDPKNSQELLEYLKFELNYTEAVLGNKWNLSKEIFRELQSRSPEYQSQVVSKFGFVYSQQEDRIIRTLGEQEEVVISKEEILSHPGVKDNEEMLNFLKDSPFVIKNLQFSHDHQLIAATFPLEFSVGLVVKDMGAGMTGFLVTDVDEYVVFDQKLGLFYVETDKDTKKGVRVWRKDFGRNKSEEEKILEMTQMNIGLSPLNSSELVYEEKDKMFSVEVSLSLSGEYVLIKSDNLSYDPVRISTEFRFRASNKAKGDFLIIQERSEGLNYDVKHQGNFFFLLVSSPEEFNGKILKLEIPPLFSYDPPKTFSISESKDLQHEFLGAKTHVPHNSKVYIEHVEAFKDHLVSILIDTDTSLQHIQVDSLSTGSTDIVSYDKYEGSLKVANNKSYRIKLDESCQEFVSNSFNYILTTLHCPPQLISYNLETRQNQLLSHLYDVPSVRLTDYASERIVLPANDGEKIPVTLIYHKKNVKTGKNAAAIVESFGGDIENSHNFEMSYFRYSALDRGLFWAIPHIRGSFDVTRRWYESGVGLLKFRHFQDLFDVIVSLFSEKIISSASGYSTCPSGGLAFASILMREPDLLSSVVLRNPLLDVFEHVKDKRTITEFGNLENLEVFKTIRSYNPYFQKFPQEFSPLMLCADYDHPLAFQSIKFLAKSRESKVSATVVYKEYPTWTSEEVKRAEELSFLVDNTRVKTNS